MKMPRLYRCHLGRDTAQQPPTRVGAGILESKIVCQVGQRRLDDLTCGSPPLALGPGRLLWLGADLGPVGVSPVGEPIRTAKPAVGHNRLL
jgi:hypothetical protein